MNSSADRADIAVVVVSHESASTLEDCLLRLRAARGVAEIRVIDNASLDGTLDIIQRHAAMDARVRFVGNPDNPGFAVACNQGAGESTAPWLAFVNPDLMIETDTLSRLRLHADALAGEVLLGVDLVDEADHRDEAARRRDPDFKGMLTAMLSSPARASKLGVSANEAESLQRVDAVSGALMLMPRVLFDRLGGFDEGYRLHAEDLDLCRRARVSGATVAVANDIRVLHLRGVSSRARPVFVEWHKHRGLWRYFRKFEAPRRSMFTSAAVFALIWSRFLFIFVRKSAGK
ncbi:glycosyl transferase [Pseudoxanthomonas yeongjuensis]|uniref:glycosyltransferase family 2 protein n=1 Tax=Pseudoxanthomonas yeongjuensis TaxID=377616 RepID=UPI001391AA24|nr:glycosyltransferase family 2 protein [Pseudoxanthomonas yeongjuensis]KAF1714232.1 glycosyl transferase [Pseudoxanthomonas yeongjuensis]